MSAVKSSNTYWANIYIGTKDNQTGRMQDYADLFDYLQGYCNRVGLCVTVTATTYIYTEGYETGYVIGLINYPRFPKTPSEITNIAIEIATTLRKLYSQERVSVVTPDNTFMIGD